MTSTEVPLRGDFQVFAKPGGALCNLECRYCYYLDKEALYPQTGPARMSEALLERYVVQHLEASGGGEVRFSWHGGEPTHLGVEYFRAIVAIQRKHAPSGVRVFNALVTNGTLLDEEWGRFLSEESFAVGLSLDGPADLHDAYRVGKGGRPTHAQVMRGWNLLRKHRVPTDILCVVHRLNARQPLRVYRFFKEMDATYVGFLPVVERRDDLPHGVSPESVGARAFGSFLVTVFDEWVTRDIGRIMVQSFDEAARPIRGLEHSLCVFRETCGDVPVLEHNGDLYSCDHFVDDAHRLGNIAETPLGALLTSGAQLRFGTDKRDRLPGYCIRCPVLDMCNGGCPKDRFLRSPDGEGGLNYLCPGFKAFFTHSRPVFEKLVPLWKAGASAEELMRSAGGLGAT
ncbi:MAG: anaerobic sulfatase maturase [Longimicrobiales bacterium]